MHSMITNIGHAMIRPLGSVAISVVALAAVIAPEASARSARPLPGPFTAIVERVIDGDTIDVRVRVWLDQQLRVRVRLGDIDAPELNSRCPGERLLARRSRDALAGLVAGSRITLVNVRSGKFYGRVIADVLDEHRRNLADRMLDEGFARPYSRRRRERSAVCRDGAERHKRRMFRVAN